MIGEVAKRGADGVCFITGVSHTVSVRVKLVCISRVGAVVFVVRNAVTVGIEGGRIVKYRASTPNSKYIAC